MSEGAKVFVIVVGCWQESVKCWDPCRRKHSGASDDWKWCKARTNKGSRKMEMVKKRRKGTNTCCNNKMQKYKFWDLLANPPTMSLILLLCSNVWGGKHGGEDWSKLTEQPGTIFNVRKRREKKDTDKPHDWKRGKRREARKESASYVSRLFLIPKVFSTYSSSPQLCVRNVIWCCGVLTYRRFIDIIMYLSFSHHYEGSIDFN